MTDLTQKFTLENNKSSDLTVIVEPWAEEIIVCRATSGTDPFATLILTPLTFTTEPR